jgi:hypothetical protein
MSITSASASLTIVHASATRESTGTSPAKVRIER